MTVIDIGTRWGSMTLQLLSACEHSRVISVDIEKTIHGGKQPVGKYILSKYSYEQLITDVVQWIAITKEQADLIFEDTAHSQETTYEIYKRVERVLLPDGIVISHDACHPKFKGAVVAGIKQAGIEPNVYLVDGDSCGFAIWQKPKVDIGRFAVELEQHIDPTMFNPITPDWDIPDSVPASPEPEPKPKRKRRKRKTVIEEV